MAAKKLEWLDFAGYIRQRNALIGAWNWLINADWPLFMGVDPSNPDEFNIYAGANDPENFEALDLVVADLVENSARPIRIGGRIEIFALFSPALLIEEGGQNHSRFYSITVNLPPDRRSEKNLQKRKAILWDQSRGTSDTPWAKLEIEPEAERWFAELMPAVREIEREVHDSNIELSPEDEKLLQESIKDIPPQVNPFLDKKVYQQRINCSNQHTTTDKRKGKRT